MIIYTYKYIIVDTHSIGIRDQKRHQKLDYKIMVNNNNDNNKK